MSDRHFAHWPRTLPRHLTVPATHLYRNIEISALRYPDKAALVFYDSVVSYARLQDETERLAAHLQQVCGVRKGDRVLLYMQNSPQFVIGFYAILRADAVVVPVNPMNLANELRHYVKDSGAAVALVTQELYAQMQPLLGEGLQHILVAAYSDYLKRPTDLKVPAFVAAPRQAIADAGVALWADALAANHRPGPMTAGPDDLCVMP
ncbi:MAG: AMP-binding protein, partial [Burkholderiaceae bacterium]|nr:AMP-binding protein [Burkholderiaceae bacterium]